MAAPKKATAPKQIVAEMAFSKSTKGTHVFTDDKDGAPITTLYVKRHGFQGDPPSSITVTVEAAE